MCGVGSVALSLNIVLHHVFHVPSFKVNVLYVSALLADFGLSINFLSNYFVIHDGSSM